MKKQFVVKKLVSLVLGLAASVFVVVGAPHVQAAESDGHWQATLVETDAEVVKIGGSWQGTTALLSDGTVRFFRARSEDERQIIGLGDNIVELTEEMALKSDGTVWVWNTSFFRTPDVWSAVQFPGIYNAVGIADGRKILLADGTVWLAAFGFWDNGELTVDYFGQMPNLSNIVAIATETALRDDGTVWDLQGRWAVHPHAERVPGISNAVAVSQQGALTSDGRVWHWNAATTRGGMFGAAPGTGNWGLTQISSVTNVEMIHSRKAVRSDGTLWVHTGGYYRVDGRYIQVQNIHNVVALSNLMVLDANGRAWTLSYEQEPVAPVETPAPFVPRLIQEGYTPPQATGPIQADTCMSLGNRSFSMASGAFVMDFANANTGQLYNFDDHLDSFSVIIRDANGQTICLHLGAILLGNGDFRDFWVGNLVTPITFYYMPVPYGYEVVRIMESGGTATFIGIDTIFHARVYIQPIANYPSSWAVDAVNSAIAAGIVPLSLQNAYTQATTRAEFTAFAVALYETVTGREITERATFNDTTDINVQKMGGLGVVGGVDNGNFNPGGTITRQEAAVMLSRLVERIAEPLPIVTPTFADNAQIASWATQAVGQIQAAGIMRGVGDNQVNPTGQFTREQSIITMLRLFEER